MTLLEQQLSECVAREQIERLKSHWQSFWYELRDFHGRRGWLALGYTSFKECVQKELGMSEVHAYRVLDAANIKEELNTNPGVSIDRATERQLRELKPLTPEQRLEVAQAIDFPNTSVREVRAMVQAIALPHVAHNTGNNEWYTPPEYIAAAKQVMGTIDLDPASSDVANRYVAATTFYTAATNGLCRQWAGKVWLNPPYAGELIGKFVDKLSQHWASGDITEAIVLVNNATETNWFQTLLGQAAGVCFPRQRVRFLDPEGRPGAPLQGQAVLYFGSNVTEFARAFLPFGAVLHG